MKRTLRLVAALSLVAVPLLASAPVAADTPDQAEELCGASTRQCAITISRDWLREGVTEQVSVVGNPNVRVEVVAYQVVLSDDGAILGLEDVGTTGELFTSSQGVARGSLTVPASDTGNPGGWVVHSTAGLTGLEDLEELLVGGVLPFGNRTPLVLGDGWAAEKPVGTPIELQYVGAIPGSRFAVEYLDETGQWQDVTAGAQAAERPDEVGTVTYFMPQGLSRQPHSFRLVGATNPVVVALWEATPSESGTPRSRLAPVSAEQLGAPPPANAAGHPAVTVRVVSAALAGAGLLVVLAWVPLSNRAARAEVRR